MDRDRYIYIYRKRLPERGLSEECFQGNLVKIFATFTPEQGAQQQRTYNTNDILEGPKIEQIQDRPPGLNISIPQPP